MNEIIVDIRISADDYLLHYQRAGCKVTTRARDGRRVEFPAQILQRFLLHNGIAGSFRIVFDKKGKFQSIERLA